MYGITFTIVTVTSFSWEPLLISLVLNLKAFGSGVMNDDDDDDEEVYSSANMGQYDMVLDDEDTTRNQRRQFGKDKKQKKEY